MCIHAKCCKNAFRLELNCGFVFINVLNTRIFKWFLWNYSNWRKKWTSIVNYVWLSHVLYTLDKKLTEYHLTAQWKSKLKETELLHVTAEDSWGPGMYCTYLKQSHSKIFWCYWRPGLGVLSLSGGCSEVLPKKEKMGKCASLFGQWSVHRHLEDTGWFPGHETSTSLKQIIISSEERDMPIKTVLVSSRDIVKHRRGGKRVKCLGKLCPGANGLQVFWSHCKASDHDTWLIQFFWDVNKSACARQSRTVVKNLPLE